MATEQGEHDYLDRPLRALLASVAGAESVPAAGSVLAVVGALAAGLTGKVAHRSSSRLTNSREVVGRADELRDIFAPFITADAIGYARALTKQGDDRATALHSLSVDLVVMVEAAAEIAELASFLVVEGNPNLRFDADAAARIAVTVAEVGAELIGANVGESELTVRAHTAVDRARLAAGQHSAVTESPEP